jgi:hypothetical protein
MALTAVARVFEYPQLRYTDELRACNLSSGVRQSLPGVLKGRQFHSALPLVSGVITLRRRSQGPLHHTYDGLVLDVDLCPTTATGPSAAVLGTPRGHAKISSPATARIAA